MMMSVLKMLRRTLAYEWPTVLFVVVTAADATAAATGPSPAPTAGLVVSAEMAAADVGNGIGATFLVLRLSDLEVNWIKTLDLC